MIQCLYDQDCPIGQQQYGDDSKTLLLLTNAANSVVGESPSGDEPHTRGYSAYGDQPDDDLQCLLAFNGELREDVGGWYLLGRGYRAYNPGLMRFHSPDSLSPFGGGGINPYMYCAGNPISFRDPTGHMYGKPDPGYVDPVEQPKEKSGWTKWLGVAIAGVILVASVIAITVVTAGAGSVAAALAIPGVKLAIAGAVVQTAAIGLQVGGVVTEDPNLIMAGQIVGGIGAAMTFSGFGIARAALKKAAVDVSPSATPRGSFDSNGGGSIGGSTSRSGSTANFTPPGDAGSTAGQKIRWTDTLKWKLRFWERSPTKNHPPVNPTTRGQTAAPPQAPTDISNPLGLQSPRFTTTAGMYVPEHGPWETMSYRSHLA